MYISFACSIACVSMSLYSHCHRSIASGPIFFYPGHGSFGAESVLLAAICQLRCSGVAEEN
jgi:hypothetical protein